MSSTQTRAAEYTDLGVLPEVLTQAAYVFFAVLEVLLAARFILRMAGADAFNALVAWVYNTTSLLILPFEGIAPSSVRDGSVLEVSTLLAMIAYLLVFYLAVALFQLFVGEEQIVDESK